MIEVLKELLNKRVVVVHDDGNKSEGITGCIKEIKEDAVRVETDACRSIWLNSKYIIKVKEAR